MNQELISFGSPNATHRIVLLHGYGATSDDLVPLGEQILEKSSKAIQIALIQGHESLESGFGRQWYPLFPPDWSKVPLAIDHLRKRLQRLSINSIPITRTCLMGFSQGGAMAIDAGSGLPFAGLIGCSAYPHPDWIPLETISSVLLIHGRQDEVVPYKASQLLYNLLKAKKHKTELISFDGGHEIPKDIIPKLISFTNSIFI